MVVRRDVVIERLRAGDRLVVTHSGPSQSERQSYGLMQGGGGLGRHVRRGPAALRAGRRRAVRRQPDLPDQGQMKPCR